MQSDNPALSASQTSRALRIFLLTGVLWAIWSVTSGIGTSIFTGYLLWAGATSSDIANLTALAYFTCLVQIVSLHITRKIRNRRNLVVGCGVLEVLFRSLTLVLPLLFVSADHRVLALYCIVVVGLCFGYSISPIFNDWMARTIPEKRRAFFTSERTLANVITSVVAGFLCGRFIDRFPEGEARFQGFAWLLGIGLVTGVSGYLLLLRAPMPEQHEESQHGFFEALADILRNSAFRRLLAFVILWQFAIGVSAPFTSIFMIEDLGLSFTTIAIYDNIALVATIISYRPIAGLISRFGSKPVIQVLLVPGVLGYVLRVFARPDFHLLLPVSYTCFAVLGAGVSVATTPLLYSLLPAKRDKTPYFAAWSSLIFLLGGIAPLLGGIIVTRLKGVRYEWFGFPVANNQIVFLVTAGLLLFLIPLAKRVEEPGAQRATWLMTRVWKGSPVAFLYNLFTMNVLGGEYQRIRSASGMARSGSPLAEEELIHALSDISPDVRREAVEGLGILGSEDAVEPLLRELADQDSDLRAEAAEALGRIGNPLSLDALQMALDDPDPRVRVSAVRGLGELGGTGIQDLLYERLQDDDGRQIFPALVDVLSRMGDSRVVQPALERLADYPSPVIRAQILNSVCRALGGDERFYRLAIMDELKQATRVDAALIKAYKDAEEFSEALGTLRKLGMPLLKTARLLFDEGKTLASFQALASLAETIVKETEAVNPADQWAEKYQFARGVCEAVLILRRRVDDEHVGQQIFLFGVICTTLSVKALGEIRVSNGNR